MRKEFMCSLIHNGILGGSLHLDGDTLSFTTTKLTVGAGYHNIVLPLADISSLKWKRVVLPIAVFEMCDGRRLSFIIFNKRGFSEYMDGVLTKNRLSHES